MKAIIKNVIIMVFVGVLAGTTSVTYAQESVQPVKTVAPDPSNTLNTGKPVVSFNIFDTESYKNIFDKNDEEDDNLEYNGRLAYNTSNTIRTTTVRYDYEEASDRVDDEQGYIIGKDGIKKMRGTVVNNGVASVGSAGVVLARDGQVNYGVLVLFILMLIAVIVLARLTIRKKNRIVMNQPFMRPMPPQYQMSVAPRYPAPMAAVPPAGYQAYHPDPRYR